MSDWSPIDAAWFEWVSTRSIDSGERDAFDAGARHGIEYANRQLADEAALAAENAKLREALAKASLRYIDLCERWAALEPTALQPSDGPHG